MRRFISSFRLMYWARRQEPRPDSRRAAARTALEWALYERRRYCTSTPEDHHG